MLNCNIAAASTGSEQDCDFQPLIASPHLSGSEPVQMVLQRLRDGQYFIPPYQREDLQWSREKQSLLLDSLVNGILLPAIILAPYLGSHGEERCEIVDGQQRITTMQDYVDGLFPLSSANRVSYRPELVRYAGRRFQELPQRLQRLILNYALTITRLAPNLGPNQRMTTFRRINEENRTLSDMELRAGEYATTARGWFFRVVGVRDPDSRSGARLVRYAKEHGVDLPWRNLSDWSGWWGDSRLAGGATPAETFLSYVVARIDPEVMKRVIQSKDLKLRYDKLTATVYDMVMERFQFEDQHPDASQWLPDLGTLQGWFEQFEVWFHAMRRHALTVTPASARKVAFFLAAAASVWEYPERLRDEHWKLIERFLRKAPKDVRSLLHIEYKVAKGYWPGLADQILYTYQACEAVVSRLAEPDEELCAWLGIEHQAVKLRSRSEAVKLVQERVEEESREQEARRKVDVEQESEDEWDGDEGELEDSNDSPAADFEDVSVCRGLADEIVTAVERYQQQHHANPTAREIADLLDREYDDQFQTAIAELVAARNLTSQGVDEYLQVEEPHRAQPSIEEKTSETVDGNRSRRQKKKTVR